MTNKYYDTSREHLVLNAVLSLEENAQMVAITHLKSHLFYNKLTRHFCEIIQYMQKEKLNISFTSIKDYINLNEDESFRKPLLNELVKIHDTELKGNLEAHIEYLESLYRNRIIDDEIVNKTKKLLLDNTTTNEIIEHLQKSMGKILVDDQVSLAESLNRVEEYIYRAQEEGEQVLKTGFSEFDEAIGVKMNRYMSLGALSSVGKSLTIYNFILGLAKHNDHKKFAMKKFSLEIPKPDMLMCMISTLARIPYKRLEGGGVKLKPEERERIKKAIQYLNSIPLDIDDGINDSQSIILKSKRFILDNPGKHIVIMLDHHKKVQYKGKDIRQAIMEFSLAIQDLVKHNPVTFILLCQLRRDLLDKKYAESKHRPSADFIEESGSIFQDCDVNFQLWRPAMYEPGDLPETHPMYFLVEKNKKGQKDFGIKLDCTLKYGLLEDPNEPLPF